MAQMLTRALGNPVRHVPLLGTYNGGNPWVHKDAKASPYSNHTTLLLTQTPAGTGAKVQFFSCY